MRWLTDIGSFFDDYLLKKIKFAESADEAKDIAENKKMRSNQKHDDWQDCPAGEIIQMVGRLNAAQQSIRTRKLYQTAVVGVLFVACGIVGVGTLVNWSSSHYGGITCVECGEHLAAYHDFKSQLGDMESALATSMTTHLENCTYCRNVFEKKYPGVQISHAIDQEILPLFAIASTSPGY